MLAKLSDPISECLRGAEECGRLAKAALAAESIEHFLKMEQRWLFLARSPELSERLNRFTRAKAGFARDALYLIRPDTYVALATADGTIASLQRYFVDRGLRIELLRREEKEMQTRTGRTAGL
jgi:hypothetical protein